MLIESDKLKTYIQEEIDICEVDQKRADKLWKEALAQQIAGLKIAIGCIDTLEAETKW